MLPRCDVFKEIIFTPRVIAFNESFVPLGKRKSNMPVAVIWHEAIAGRTKEDIISTFHAFITHKRDVKIFHLWLDNCAAQNKNWALFSYFYFIVNSSLTMVEEVNLKYFEPGHTFMSADAFHHQVELSLKKKKKVYDFTDFKECIQRSNSSRVVTIEMKLENFYDWKDHASQYKLGKLNPRVYLKDMVHVHFRKGAKVLFYKTSFSDENYTELEFLKAKIMKDVNVAKPDYRTIPRGIQSKRKSELIQKLGQIFPANRMNFWKDLPENDVEPAE